MYVSCVYNPGKNLAEGGPQTPARYAGPQAAAKAPHAASQSREGGWGGGGCCGLRKFGVFMWVSDLGM